MGTIAPDAGHVRISKGRPRMADFPVCYAFVLANEDYNPPRYQTVPDPTKTDPLALAISGINSAAFPEDFEAVFEIPVSQRAPAVQAFYQKTYWNAWLSRLDNPIAMRVMDAEVNSGGDGIRLLQRACNALGAKLEVDEAWGPLTVAAAQALNQVALVGTFKSLRVDFYISLGGPDVEAWIARARK
jgi:hypothetical protein